ncbi:MAG: hypothetical protein ACMG6S_21790, partial [Byssovorax sp.]
MGFLGAAALVAAACSSTDGSDGPSRGGAPGSRLMNIGGFAPVVDAGQAILDATIAGGAGGTGPVSSSVAGTGGSGAGGPVSSSVAGSGGSGGSGAGGPMSSSVAGTGGSGGSGSVSSASSSSGMTKGIDGSPCGMGLDCMSGSCADGVCCNVACGGVCAACSMAKKGGGADGVCGFIAAASDPDSECPAQGPPCGAPGLCNGSGACQPALANGTVCGAGTCSGNFETDPPVCAGGLCAPSAPHACATCKDAFVCQQGCAQDGDCPMTQFCSAGSCVLKLVPGVACTKASQCASGSCVDGVCCDAACNAGPCEACTAAKGASKDGACTPLNGAPPVGASCADQVACTDDTCSGGACVHVAKDCSSTNPCVQAGSCDAATGNCVMGAPVMCPPAAACEIAGACAAQTGLCAPPSPVVCPAASDACHVAATCDASTGKCGAETPLVCPSDGLAACETRV